MTQSAVAQSKAVRFGLIAVRVLFALPFIASSLYFFSGKMQEPPPPAGDAGLFMIGLKAAHYLMPLVKVIELSTGLLILFNRFVPLALILIAPILVNIFCVHAFLMQEGLPIAIVLVVLFGLLAFHHRGAFAPLLKAKN